MKLYLKKSHYNTILTHCTAGLPNESCGLLAGTEEDEEITVAERILLIDMNPGSQFVGDRLQLGKQSRLFFRRRGNSPVLVTGQHGLHGPCLWLQ